MRSLTLTWPGGEHEFALNIGALRAIQAASDAGPQEILQRMMVLHWRIDDVLGVIRHGLEGGGMAKSEARVLVEAVVDQAGLLSLVPVAQAILTAALVGDSDDPVGEPQGVTPAPENGGSASSTPQGRPPGSPRPK